MNRIFTLHELDSCLTFDHSKLESHEKMLSKMFVRSPLTRTSALRSKKHYTQEEDQGESIRAVIDEVSEGQ